MERVTRKDLDRLLERLQEVASAGDYDFSIGRSYGGYRLESKNGSVDVSPRLSARGLQQWMFAFIAGLNHATKAGYFFPVTKWDCVSCGTLTDLFHGEYVREPMCADCQRIYAERNAN